jgi:hypothetical protein
MTWFAASIIIAMRRIDQPDGPFLAHENVVLLEAASAAEALSKAKEIGAEQGTPDSSFTIDDQPAVQSFAGIRKLISISNPDDFNQDKDPPSNGTEITYSLFELDDAAALEALVDGKEVRLSYRE